MATDRLRIEYRPDLHEARMIVGFSGWMDGGEVSTGTIEYLAKRLEADPLGRIEPDDFYIYNVPGPMEIAALFRPHARISDGLLEAIEEPENVFYVAEESNLILFKGKEPNLRWKAFSDCMYQVVSDFDVRSIYFVGSVGGLVPHTREPAFWTSMSEEEMREHLTHIGLSPTNYEGPASFASYLLKQAQAHGVQAATCVAGIPSYVEGRNVKCIEAVTRKVLSILDLQLDISDLSTESEEFVTGLNKIVEANPKLAEKVRQLEQLYDNEIGPEEIAPESQEDLRSWFERQDLGAD